MSAQSFSINQQLTSVRLCATGNVSGIYYNGPLGNGIGATLTASSVSSLSIDSVSVNENDRILLPAQTNTNENGIYVVQSKGSSISLWILKRAEDFQSLEQLKAGQYLSIDAGSTLGGNMMVLIEPIPSNIGIEGTSGSVFYNVTTGGGGGGGGPFLRIANNLSDVANIQDSLSNIGQGSGGIDLLTDADFPGGIKSLTNPCENYLRISCSTPGNILRLPPANGDDSFSLSNGPWIDILPGFQPIIVQDSTGGALITIASPGFVHFISDDNTSPAGSWAFRSFVSLVNNKSGNVIVDLQNAYDNSSPAEIDVSANDLTITNGSLGINTVSISDHALFQVESTTEGTVPFPRMSDADEATLEALLLSEDAGLCVYNTDFDTIDYFNGTSFTNVISIDHLIAGSNVNLVNNMDGTLTIDASGGTSTVTSAQSAFVVVANPTDTTFSTPGETKPITIDPTKFSSITAINFSNFVNVNTPTTELLETGTRKIFFNATISMKMNTGIQNTYQFYIVIRTSPSTITTTTFQSEVSLTPLSTGLVSIPLNGILPMSQNDSIEIWVTNLGGTDPLQIVSVSAQAWDLTQQGYASTDDLVQGTSNLYLSQNGGTTYQNVTGLPVVVDNVVTFSSTGGGLKDSGTSLTGFIKQGDSGIYFGAPVSSPFVSPKMLNLYGTSGSGAANWYSNVDNYPLFQLSQIAHDNNNINFDCYYDGTNLRASTSSIAWQISKAGGSLKFSWGTALQGNILGALNDAVIVDAAGRVTLPQGGTLETLRLGTSSSVLNTTTPALSFNANYGAGNLLNLAGSGRNIGFQTNMMFLTYNANYNGGLADYQISASGSVFVQEISSTGILWRYQTSGTGGAAASLSNALTLNTSGQIGLPQLSAASTLLASDSGRHIEAAVGFYTLGGITLNNGNGPLISTTAVLNFDSVLSDGDYLSFGGSGRNMGIDSSGSNFWSYNLDWNGGTGTYVFNTSGNGFAIEMTSTGILFKTAPSGTGGTPATPTTGMSVNLNGRISIAAVSASSMVTSDASGFLQSTPLLGITSLVTVTGSSQAMSTNVRYVNNYTSGQCAYTLPSATGTGKIIDLVSLTTASTSGWKITANGTDKIQFMSSLGAAGSVLTSTIGSSVDCATLIDVASGLWVVYPAAGLNLTVT